MFRKRISVTSLLVLLAACGGAPVATQAPTVVSIAQTPDAPATTASEPTVAPTTEPQPTPALAAVTAAVTGETAYQVPGFPAYTPAPPLLEEISQNDTTIRVKHAYGETDIPAKPQRIYVSDETTLQVLLSLGLKPVGTATFTDKLPPGMSQQGTGVTLLRDNGEGVNLEQLAALKPDLIFGSGLSGPGSINEEQYAKLRQIAPTVVFTGNSFFFWREATRELGTFFGVPEKAETVLAEYDAKIAGYRERAKAAIGDETLTILLLFDTTMWLYSVGGMFDNRYLPLSPTSWAYNELQIAPGPEVQKLAGEQSWAEISLELIPELKADHLVVFPNAYGGEEIGTGLKDYQNSPLWQTIPAAKSGNVYMLIADNATAGYWTTPYLIEQFLTELEK